MLTLSIVSHRQGAITASLLKDLERIASPLVAAITLTRNVAEEAFDIPPSLRTRTQVIDNAAPRGFGANHNAAFARCATPFFVILNPDIRLPSDPFPALQARLADERVALVAPLIVAPDGREEDAARQLITPWRLIARRLASHDRSSTEFDWLAGMFLATRSIAFREIGGFDERYFMYCEDFDLCARLRLAGRSIVLARDVRVIHDARRASHRSVRHLRWHVESLMRMWTSSAFWRYRRVLAGTSS